MQLAGHRALQEWNLLRPEERLSCAKATEALRLSIDFKSKAIAAQDFRHTTERESEPVSDFIIHFVLRMARILNHQRCPTAGGTVP